MPVDVNSFAYFPSFVYRDERPEWVEILLNTTEKFFTDKTKEQLFYQTININKFDDFSFLINYLNSLAYDILKSQGYHMDQCEFYVSALWGQKIDKTAGTNVHVHKNSQLCGWIFLETPINGSYPIFYDPRKNKQMVELDYILSNEVTNATPSIHFNNIIPGTIIISNSWLEHQLSQNLSDFSSTSLHFIISHKEKLCNT